MPPVRADRPCRQAGNVSPGREPCGSGRQTFEDPIPVLEGLGRDLDLVHVAALDGDQPSALWLRHRQCERCLVGDLVRLIGQPKRMTRMLLFAAEISSAWRSSGSLGLRCGAEQPSVLGFHVAERAGDRSAREDRLAELAEFVAQFAGDQYGVVRREERSEDGWVALDREPEILAKAVDDEIRVARRTPNSLWLRPPDLGVAREQDAIASVIGVPVFTAAPMNRPALAAVTHALSAPEGATDFSYASSGAVLQVASKRPVLSPKFMPRAEAAMAATLRDIAAALPGARGGVVTVEEFRGPWGIPDLAALAPARAEQRLSCEVPPLLSEHDCLLVVAASHWTESASLAAVAGISAGPAERHIRRLVRHGALERRGSRVRRNPGMVPLGRLWAIEAKIEDWQSGLSQVHRYRLWADGAVLVLDRARVPVEAIAAQARHYRVGVVVNGRWVARPRVKPPEPATRLHASEHMLAALIGGAPSARS